MKNNCVTETGSSCLNCCMYMRTAVLTAAARLQPGADDDVAGGSESLFTERQGMFRLIMKAVSQAQVTAGITTFIRK